MGEACKTVESVPNEFHCSLDDVAWLAVQGPDAGTFLQAQLTSDVLALLPMRRQLSAWCSPKGRVLATLQVLCIDSEQYLLRVPAALAQGLARRLGMYVLRARVQVSISDHCTVGIRLTEAHARAAGLPLEPYDIAQLPTTASAGQAPDEGGTDASLGPANVHAFRPDDTEFRHELLGSADGLPLLRSLLAAAGAPAPA